jgi:aerobic carbon-monoxide dehydrogenase large subunit
MIKFGIGQAVRRVEDQRFLTGQGRYVDDIVLSGMCYGVNVLSPHAHARVKMSTHGRRRRHRACCWY